MNFQIYYGIIDNYYIDVTRICIEKLLHNNIITIPWSDYTRSYYFTDPLHNILKKIYIKINDETLKEIDNHTSVSIDITNYNITTINYYDIQHKLFCIHNKLNFNFGNIKDELPEQMMVVKYLTGYEKVLEFGSNIGRNSLVIASILKEKDNNNFVTLESDETIAEQLKYNRDINNFNFHIINAALSKNKLIQSGWNTFVSNTLLDGYKFINIISLDEIYSKFNIAFDTLIIDCEGAFYFILLDFPEILNNIKLIIMENDYIDISHKNYIDDVLKKNNFYVEFCESGGWGPCSANFYEVWKKEI